jgi:hypothetical protein
MTAQPLTAHPGARHTPPGPGCAWEAAPAAPPVDFLDKRPRGEGKRRVRRVVWVQGWGPGERSAFRKTLTTLSPSRLICSGTRLTQTPAKPKRHENPNITASQVYTMSGVRNPTFAEPLIARNPPCRLCQRGPPVRPRQRCRAGSSPAGCWATATQTWGQVHVYAGGGARTRVGRMLLGDVD